MSKKIAMSFTVVFVFIFSLYLGYSDELTDTIAAFFKTYLDNVQKYLFVISIFSVLAIYCTRIPFLESSFRVRLKDKLFLFVEKRALVASLLLSAVTFLSFLLSAFVFGKTFEFSINYIFVFVRLFIFVFGCFSLYNILYFFTQKVALSSVLVLLCNLTLLSLLTGINYYVPAIQISGDQEMTILSVYNFVIITASAFLLLTQGERKECLK